ncbi:Glyoxalase-like_dom domain-containing protein [Pseudozyma hubeiensis]|nr:Glyoxalase-like_dom domain-containing protein [Pseudozyma hubeiensis]
MLASTDMSAAVTSLVPALDHLILLVNDPRTASSQRTSALERAILLFSELGFQVVRGGTHADGLTSNVLIVFPDGVYIELIQFEPSPAPGSGESQQDFETRRKRHWWYHCRQGWIDWCLQDGISDKTIESINENARRLRESALQELSNKQRGEQDDSVRVIAPRLLYQQPQEGGRVTTTGDEIKWKVTFPSPPGPGDRLPIGNARSHVPFWCADLTPRQLRVPLNYAHHNNHSPGIAEITLLYAHDTVTRYLDVSLALNQPIQPDTLPITSDFQLVPNEIPYRLLSTPASTRKPDANAAKDITTSSHHESARLLAAGGMETRLIRVVVKVAEDPEDRRWIEEHGEGLYEVAIYVAADKLPPSGPPDGIELTTFEAGFGRIRLSPILH